jgi:hypothetical protein
MDYSFVFSLARESVLGLLSVTPPQKTNRCKERAGAKRRAGARRRGSSDFTCTGNKEVQTKSSKREQEDSRAIHVRK